MDPRLFSLADEQLFPDLRGQLGASLDQLERYSKILENGREQNRNLLLSPFSVCSGGIPAKNRPRRWNLKQPLISWRGRRPSRRSLTVSWFDVDKIPPASTAGWLVLTLAVPPQPAARPDASVIVVSHACITPKFSPQTAVYPRTRSHFQQVPEGLIGLLRGEAIRHAKVLLHRG